MENKECDQLEQSRDAQFYAGFAVLMIMCGLLLFVCMFLFADLLKLGWTA